MLVPIQIHKNVYRRIKQYVRYISRTTNSNLWVPYNVAVDKWNYIIDSIIAKIGDDANGGRICPYTKFSNNGMYRMEQIQDKKTRTTVWDIAFADYDTYRTIYAIELDKILAASNESVFNISFKEALNEMLVQKKLSERCFENKAIHINQDDFKSMIRNTLSRIFLREATINGRTYMTKKMMGKWECIDGMYGDYDFSEYGKGNCQDVRMYMDTTVSRDECGTICLFRREDTGKYFYCEIVDAPEKGANETKFSLLPRSKVPREIRSDFRTLPLPPERVLASPSWRKKGTRFLFQ